MLKRTLLALLLACAPLGAAPVASAQTPPVTAPVFPGRDGSPHYLLGVSAYGTAADLDRLEAAARGHGWPTARDLDTSGRVSLVIGFPKATTADVDAFLKQAAAGQFGTFTFQSTMAPVAAAPKR